MNGQNNALKISNKILLIVAGLIIGGINGLFGSGGGMLAVPALMYLSGLKQKCAQATAMAVILPVSLISAVTYVVIGNYDFDVSLWAGIGAISGATVGALILPKISDKALSVIFAAIMIAAGVKSICG